MPPSGALHTWCVAVTVAALLLGLWEGFWRSRGWHPAIEAARSVWVLARLRVRPSSTVLLGSSRIGAAVDPLIWATTLGGTPPIMLAIEGEGTLPLLTEFARDTTFHGHLVVEMMAPVTFSRTAANSPLLDDYIKAYRATRASPALLWEAWLRVRVPGHLVFRRIELLPNRIVPTLVSRRPVRPVHYSLRDDHFRPIDFRIDGFPPNRPEIMDTAHFRYIRKWGVPRSPRELDTLIARVTGDVRRIQARGGDVTFIVLQGCGGRRAVELDLYPKVVFWNRLRSIPGARSIDSDDHVEIADLPCYDGSHIDVSFVPAVTRLIAHLVASRDSL